MAEYAGQDYVDVPCVRFCVGNQKHIKHGTGGHLRLNSTAIANKRTVPHL